MSAETPWPHGKAIGETNVWPETVPHCYEVTLQPTDVQGRPHLMLIIVALNIADAIQQAETKYPGHIARNVEDVS